MERRKKLKICKSFRLIDFHIFDEKPNLKTVNSSESESENETTPSFSDSSIFNIQMFGVNEEGETCSIIVDDFQPFFFVKVGDNWTQQDANSLLQELRTKVSKYFQPSILSAEIQEYYKLYGFSGGKKDNFVKITFKNTIIMNKIKNLWFYYEENKTTGERYRKIKPFIFKRTTLELYESNIPPLLRYFHIQNISPSGWISISTTNSTVPDEKTTTCTFEYITSLKHIKSLNDKETRIPYKICSFDIEASSSHGDFPIPIKTYKRLATNIVDIFEKQLKSQTLNQEQSQLYLEKMILTAFGFDSVQHIDLVYPKTKNIKKTEIKKKVEELLRSSIDSITKLLSSNNNILTINSFFEKGKDEMQKEFDLGNNENGDDDSDNENDEKFVPNKNNKKNGPIPQNKTIINVLLDKNISRDDKIKCTNEIFTIAFPRLEGDKVTFIGSTFMRFGEKNPYLNNCIVLGSCDPVEGAEIETAESERELLLRWTELIEHENPDIIIGYNIFGFDYEFLFRRSQETDCTKPFLQLSRKIGDVCGKTQKNIKDFSGQIPNDDIIDIENTKIQLASGEYDLRFFKMMGRIQIDLYTYFRREFSLASYKLDDVAGQYISDDIIKSQHIVHDLLGEITQLESKNLTGLKTGDYIHLQVCGFTADYIENGKKFKVLDIIKSQDGDEKIKNYILIDGYVQNLDKHKNIKWTMAKDDVTPQDIFRLSKGSASDRAIVAKYCIQDCNLVHYLFNKIDVITGYIEMSRICSVPISFLVFRGQGIKLTSYLSKKCREKNTLMPDLEKSFDNDGYEGAIVLSPKCAMYGDNPVACLDFESLYPSVMISQNYSQDTKVFRKEYDLAGKLIRESGIKNPDGTYKYDNIPGEKYIEREFDSFKYVRNTPKGAAKKEKCGTIVCRWAQNKKGILPSILEELLKARADTRKMAKIETDPFMQNILDKRQLNYKVTANSIYGQCGSKTSTFYEKDIAASTTATGRTMITYAKRIIEEVYGDSTYDTQCHGLVKTRSEYVYGDTDSVFFTFNLEDPKTGEKIRGQKALEITIEIAQHAAELCSLWLKAPMRLSYEKTLMIFTLLAKKRYFGMLYENDPKKGKLKFMGLSIKRRDSCDYLKDVYGEILNIFMRGGSIEEAILFLEKSLDDLIEGKVPMDKLALTKALRSDYKNPDQIAHNVLSERIGNRDPGNKPKPGDRIKFLYIVNDKPKALLGEKIETPQFIVEHGLKIDYVYYITNQLMKPLQQLFGLALEQIWILKKKGFAIKEYHKELISLEKEYPDFETMMKKKEKLCAAKVKVLLFDKFLNKIYHQKHRIQTIDSYFTKKT